MKTSPLHKLLVLTLAAGGMLVQTCSGLITIDVVAVGNAGNAADPTTGYGAVGYDYGIGKYEVTLNQYTAFLNAVGATDTYGLYNPGLGSDLKVRGIARNGSAGSYSYSVIGSGNRPVAWVTWSSAARFVNWLHNGQPIGAQTTATTEAGAYTLDGYTGGMITRNANAKYGLPSENEWYKAAYHQPTSVGGDIDNYWSIATGSNLIPNSRNGSSTDPNSGNFFRNDFLANGFNDGYAVSQSPILSGSQPYLTDVGAFSLADSYYGAFDLAGNVAEWNEGMIGTSRLLRGGSWRTGESILSAGVRTGVDSAFAYDSVGFRIVIIPEPSVVALATVGATLLVRRLRKARSKLTFVSETR